MATTTTRRQTCAKKTNARAMNDEQLLRYSRHILLPQIGIEGQKAFADAHVLVVGAGGLGSPALIYLASAGVGHITLADGDRVDLTNLQRQIVHRARAVGTAKTHSAAVTLREINPECRVLTLPQRLEGDLLMDAVAAADVVLDCCDNFATRHAVNRACVQQKRPLVSGAGIRFDGQIAVFDARQSASPCYHCLFPEAEDAEELRCAVTGVFAPLTGIIGTLQAAEALKLVSGIGTSLAGRLLLFDALQCCFREIRVPRDPACPVCSSRA